MVLFGQKCLGIRAKWLYLGKSGCIQAKLFYSVKVVVFGQKLLYSGKSSCIRAN